MPDSNLVKKKYMVSELIDETPEVLLIRFKPEDGKPIAFDPGMFFMISGLNAEGKQQVSRAFSIASDPASPEMEYYIVKEHGGHKTHFLTSNPGDPYMMTGPHGQFKFVPSVDKKVVFIAGGTGLAPFMSMLRHIEKTNAGTDIVLLYSVKYPTEIIRKQELFKYSDSLHARIIVTVTRSKPEDGWTGESKRIDSDMIKKYAADYADRIFYICGPLPFVTSMKDAIKALGVNDQNVKADVWG